VEDCTEAAACLCGVEDARQGLSFLPPTHPPRLTRAQDPGSAPVLGERVKYIITMNAERQITAKAEPFSHCGPGMLVDRHFYLAALRKAVDGIFLPIIEQRMQLGAEVSLFSVVVVWGVENNKVFLQSATTSSSQKSSKDHLKHKEKFASSIFNAQVKRESERMLWSDMLEGRLTTEVSPSVLLPSSMQVRLSFGGQDKELRDKERREAPIMKAFFTKAAPMTPPPVKKNKKSGKIIRNDAEVAQMSHLKVQKEMDISDKKRKSKEESPLLKAFAKQALSSKKK